MLESIHDATQAAKLARQLLNSNDDVVVRRAVQQLISSGEVTESELDMFQHAEDHVVRTYATEVNSNTSNLLVSLHDAHPDVRRQSAASLLGMELTKKESTALQNAIIQDDALWKLAVPIALERRLPNLLDLMKSKSSSQRKFLVQSLKDAVVEADDERLTYAHRRRLHLHCCPLARRP